MKKIMKNNYFLRTVFTLLLCGCFSMSFAADWYISSAGNDTTGDGSMGNPWATFSKAQTGAASGDIVHVSGMIDFSLDPANSASPKIGILLTKSIVIQGTSNTNDGFDGKGVTRFIHQSTAGTHTLTIKNLKLINGLSPTTTNGGALQINGATLICENVIFDSNNATTSTRTGGAIHVDTAIGMTFTNCIIKNNSASKSGAIYINGLNNNAVILFQNCAFLSNSAKDSFGGSALYIRTNNGINTTLNLINCTVKDNIVQPLASNGGAIFYGAKSAASTNVNIINCTITDNITYGSATNAAGVYFLNTSANGCLGNIYINNSIIENNRTLSGAYSDLGVGAVSPTIAGGGSATVPGYIKIQNSIIGAVPTDPLRVPAATNIVASPLYNYLTGISKVADLRANLGTFNATTNSYPLLATSPAIDYGAQSFLSAVNVTTDQLGITRSFTGSLCSVGSIEFSSTAGEIIWKGTTSDDVTLGSNWFAGALPTSTDFIIIPKGKPFYPTFAADLTLNGGLIESGAKLTVTDAIINNGTLTIENNANLIQSNNVTNSGSGSTIVKRNSNALHRLDYSLWSSPVSGAQTLADFSPLTSQSPNRFYTFDPNGYQYVTTPFALPFVSGTGYLIRMPNTDSTTNYDAGIAPISFLGIFTGTPNNGDITVNTVATKYNASGNPYPSVIDAELFKASNSDINTLYFWRKTNNPNQGTSPSTSYAVYNIATATGTGVAPDGAATGEPTITPDKYIQVGQGFLFETAQSSVVFNNAMRIANNGNKFLKTKQLEKSRIWLNLSNALWPINQMALCYTDGASKSLDESDSKYINDSPTALTSKIDNGEYTIQGRPTFDATDVVALNFKTDLAGDYTIAIDHTDGVFASEQPIYLVDSKTRTETDLKASSYTFNAAVGQDNNRFSLKYQKTLKVDALAFNENSVTVYKNKGALYVISGSETISNIKVYDIQGRLIAEQKNVKATSTSLHNLKASNQVLIVKISGENNQVVTKKVLN